VAYFDSQGSTVSEGDKGLMIKQTNDYLFNCSLQYSLTFGIKDIAIINILNRNVRNFIVIIIINNNVVSEKIDRWGGYCKTINTDKILGMRNKINNDVVDKKIPIRIADLLPFFAERQIFNEKRPKARYTIELTRYVIKYIVAISGSGFDFEKAEKKLFCIISLKLEIEFKKNITPETKYSHSNFVINFGFSSILFTAFEKYCLVAINFFGGELLMTTVNFTQLIYHSDIAQNQKQ